METIDNNFTPPANPIQQLHPAVTKQHQIRTQAQRDEILALAAAGNPPSAIAMLLHLTERQVIRTLNKESTDDREKTMQESIQRRRSAGGSKQQEVANLAHPVLLKVLGKIKDLVEEETDISKLSTAARVLATLLDQGEVKEEITETVSRLRGR